MTKHRPANFGWKELPSQFTSVDRRRLALNPPRLRALSSSVFMPPPARLLAFRPCTHELLMPTLSSMCPGSSTRTSPIIYPSALLGSPYASCCQSPAPSSRVRPPRGQPPALILNTAQRGLYVPTLSYLAQEQKFHFCILPISHSCQHLPRDHLIVVFLLTVHYHSLYTSPDRCHSSTQDLRSLRRILR
ncbi:hypothetical protein GY45DRAFT_541160 [Cubamyces sp. BRFM 1775]|nr:hypothetical protein GY45DRAFT_541160 [Cubamyces sp. BRFM 1775]